MKLVLPTTDNHNPDTTWKSEWFGHFDSKLIPKDIRGYLNIGDSYACYVYIHQHIHDWLIDNNIKYKLECEYKMTGLTCYMIFENKDDAVLFKLRWF
jgi:hypothetical protein